MRRSKPAEPPRPYVPPKPYLRISVAVMPPYAKFAFNLYGVGHRHWITVCDGLSGMDEYDRMLLLAQALNIPVEVDGAAEALYADMKAGDIDFRRFHTWWWKDLMEKGLVEPVKEEPSPRPESSKPIPRTMISKATGTRYAVIARGRDSPDNVEVLVLLEDTSHAIFRDKINPDATLITVPVAKWAEEFDPAET